MRIDIGSRRYRQAVDKAELRGLDFSHPEIEARVCRTPDRTVGKPAACSIHRRQRAPAAAAQSD